MKAILLFVEVAGILAFAWSGYVEARRKEMDPVGAFTVAFVTAFGGGTLRDVLLEHRPLVWIEHQEYPLMIFVFALTAYVLERRWPRSAMLPKFFSEKAILVPDALGMALSNASSVALAWRSGNPAFICILLGGVASISGGVIRDVLCNEVPLVFRRGTLYATCAFAGGVAYCVVALWWPATTMPLLAGMLVSASLRLLAVNYDWRLP